MSVHVTSVDQGKDGHAARTGSSFVRHDGGQIDMWTHVEYDHVDVRKLSEGARRMIKHKAVAGLYTCFGCKHSAVASLYVLWL